MNNGDSIEQAKMCLIKELSGQSILLRGRSLDESEICLARYSFQAWMLHEAMGGFNKYLYEKTHLYQFADEAKKEGAALL